MKNNKLLSLSIIALILALCFSGCSKEDISSSTKQGNLMKSIESLNSSYSGNRTTNWWSFKKWCRVGAADVCGAAGGAWLGGKIGALFAPESGGSTVAVGATIGAVVVGAAASYGASSIDIDNPQNLKPIKDGANNYQIEYITSNNPFDSVGIKHNLALKKAILKGNIIKFSTFKSTLRGNQQLFINHDNGLSQDAITFFLDQKNFNRESFNIWLENKVQNDTEESIISSFINTIYRLQNYKDYQNYIFDFETLIIKNNDLNSNVKKQILMTTSVARYSGQFWHSVIK